MKKAGVVFDDYKLPIFKKGLDALGYKYSEHEGPVKGCILLKIETDDLLMFKIIVEDLAKEANKLKKP